MLIKRPHCKREIAACLLAPEGKILQKARKKLLKCLLFALIASAYCQDALKRVFQKFNSFLVTFKMFSIDKL